MKNKLSIIIVAKNEEELVEGCLKSARPLQGAEIVFLDTGSTDKTPAIAKKYADKLIIKKYDGLHYAEWRNLTMNKAAGEWLFYLDADERITPELANEVNTILKSKFLNLKSAYAIPRRNFLLGKELHYGGWWPDYVKRLYRREALKGWRGGLHEEPVFDGKMGKLENPLIHIQPDKIEPAFEKTIKWSKIEAQLLFRANHPPVVWWRIIRVGLTTLFDRLIKKQGFRDGTEGWIESIYQTMHSMIIYMQLWEMQREAKTSL